MSRDEFDEIDENEIEPASQAVLSDSAITYTDWTAETIVSQIRKGNIILDPIFQRRDAWRAERKSRFIESVILGVPVPQIVLAERQLKQRGSFVVIDGKQRLITLQQFCNTRDEILKLSSLQVLKELNGHSYKDLEGDASLSQFKNVFDNQSIRTVVIKHWKSEDALYDMFLRLNTGSLPLSSQELRQALHPGEFNRTLDKFAESCTSLHEVLGKSEADFRMRDVEIILRYIAIRHLHKEYKGNLKAALDGVTITFNTQWSQHKRTVEKYLEDFRVGVDTACSIFGRTDALRKWNGTKFERQINRAVADVVLIYLSTDDVLKTTAKGNPVPLQDGFKALCLEPAFERAVSGTTKSVGAFQTRFDLWQAMAERSYSITLPRFTFGS